MTEPAETALDVDKERQYQHDYYQTRRVDRLAAARHRWQTDAAYREREQRRARNARALRRRETAPLRFEMRVAVRRATASPVRTPRLVEVGSRPVWVYTTGVLAREVGRATTTIRAWLDARVLPGCTIIIGENKCMFSDAFIAAVRAACARLCLLNGRGERDVLRRLVIEELERRHEPFVPAR